MKPNSDYPRIISYIRHWKVLFSLPLLWGGSLSAGDYYVSTTGVDGSGVGGGIGAPWATIRYALTRLTAGDTLHIRAGNYREFNINTFPSGSSGENGRVTVKSYKNEAVVISSMVDASGTEKWTQVGGGVYSYNGALNYRHVSIGGVPLRLMTAYNNFNGASSDISGPWQWSRSRTDAKLWVYAPGGVNPGSLDIEISDAYATVSLQNTLGYITLDGLTIEGGYYPVDIAASYVELRNCTFRNCFGDAVKVEGWTPAVSGPEWNSVGGVIDNCDMYYFGESGIDVTGGDYWSIYNANIHHGIANRSPGEGLTKVNGIMIKNNSVGCVVDGCRMFELDTVFGAISIGGSSLGSPSGEAVEMVVKNNIIHDVTGPYIVSFTGAVDCRFVNNVIYECNTVDPVFPATPKALIQIRNSDGLANLLVSSGAVVTNNVFYSNYSIYDYSEKVDGNDDGAVINHNLLGEERDSFFDGVAMSPAQMAAVKQYDTLSIRQVPPFESYVKGLVRLDGSSAAAEGGVYDGNVRGDYNGQKRLAGASASMGAYERLGVTTYCDGTSTANWVVPVGGGVSSVHDGDIDSDVIETTGDVGKSYMLYADANGASWVNSEEYVVSFSAKFVDVHHIMVRFMSSGGMFKIVKFYSDYSSVGQHTSTLYRFALGAGPSSTQDGNWHDYVFNLAELVAQVDPQESVVYIDRFYVNGGGRVDDIRLHNNETTACVPNGLIGDWRLDEGEGAYTEDTSGLGRHGTLTNLGEDPGSSSWIAGREQKALSFGDKSVAQKVAIDHSPVSFSSGFTVDVTVRFDNLDTTYDVIAQGFQGDSSYGRLYEQSGLVYLQVRVMDGGSPKLLFAVTQPNKVKVGEWCRITAKCDPVAGQIRLYVDGVNVTDMVYHNHEFTPAPLITGTGVMSIGGSSIAQQTFEGQIDRVKLFNRPLTDAEIVEGCGL